MSMIPSISSEQVTTVLKKLYEDAERTDPKIIDAASNPSVKHANEAQYYRAMRDAYLPVGPHFGHLLYTLARGMNAQTVVEFGTSFGISTIYLSAAMRDNGRGKVITSEFEPTKTERAKQNLTEAGLVDWVEFRIGDALQTLADTLPGPIDFVLLDGAKGMYLDVLKVVESRLRPGAIIASDNTDNPTLAPFLDYVRNPGNGYVSSGILTNDGDRNKGHEITIRSVT